jgi:hypothetical protein
MNLLNVTFKNYWSEVNKTKNIPTIGKFNFIVSINNKKLNTECLPKKVNVYLPSLMMKVPDHIYVLG